MTVTPENNVLPDDYEKKLVQGFHTFLDDTPSGGTIQFSSSTRLVSGSTHQIIMPRPISAPIDPTTGFWSIRIPSTNDPDIRPHGWFYRVQEPDGTIRDFAIPHDAEEPIWFDTLIEVSNPQPLPASAYVPADRLGVAGGVATLGPDGKLVASQIPSGLGTGDGSGANGLSAYELAVQNGYVGNVNQWLLSLKGAKGDPGDDGAPGETGDSAYEVAVANGFIGDVDAWLLSLKGAKGDTGEASLVPGPRGLSAYEVAVQSGFSGTEAQWLESLKGQDGQDGQDGTGTGTGGPTTIANVEGLQEELDSKLEAGDLEAVNPVLTINGNPPDENGNAVVSGGTGGADPNMPLFAYETQTGYALEDGSAVITPLEGRRYWFNGWADPPFRRDYLDRWSKDPAPGRVVYGWQLVSEDAFDDGLNLATPADVSLKAKWGSDRLAVQSSTGRLKPSGWSGSTSGNYALLDTTAAAKVMAAEITVDAYSNTTTKRAWNIVLNASDPTMTGVNITGYTIGLESDGTTTTWTCRRRVAGAATSIGTSFTEPTASTPMSYRCESDGLGGLSLLRNGVEVKKWQDTNPEPLTGIFAGLFYYHQSGSANTASQAVRAENWKLYKK